MPYGKNNRKAGPERDLRDLEEFKNLLGPLTEDYTEGQLRQLQREMFSMAELLLDLYLLRRRAERGRELTDISQELG